MNLFDAPVSFWIAAALLTAISVVAALWPVWRRSGRDYGDVHEGTREVLIAQLSELERDKKNGLIDEEQAASARAEVGRRLLAIDREGGDAGDSAETATPKKYRAFQIASILLIPLAGLITYALTGAPTLPDQPIASRQDRPVEEQDIQILVARTEQHLRANPNDLRGWLVIAPIYMSMGRMGDAEDAYRQILNIGPEDKEVLAGAQGNLGQIIARRANGIISPEALELFVDAQKNNPKDPTGFFFEALYHTQQNDSETAIPLWNKLIADFGNEDAPWLGFAQQTLAQLQSPQSGPTEEDVSAAEELSPQEQRAFIESMVQSLADRLNDNPDDLTGWSRLIQAYMVLGEKDKAAGALTRAREAFAGKEEALAALDAVAKNFEL